ncbi:MAG: hypothetical protein ACTHK2_03815 [Dokdonella sp.]|uniref:hypothetical protein n=1 Tax=Dokdonella sp. TaxID=2291710 RepID=UPI003F7D9C4A
MTDIAQPEQRRDTSMPLWLRVVMVAFATLIIWIFVLALLPRDPQQAGAPETTPCRESSAVCAFKSDRQALTSACKTAVEHEALTELQWTRDGDDLPFDRVMWWDEQRRVLLLAGDDLRVRNQYGTFENSIATCRIAVDTHAVSLATIQPGRW